jgi:hypothetical protein
MAPWGTARRQIVQRPGRRSPSSPCGDRRPERGSHKCREAFGVGCDLEVAVHPLMLSAAQKKLWSSTKN